MISNKFYIFILLIFLLACKEKTPTGLITTPIHEAIEEESPLVRGNRKMVALENEEIDLFIKRYGWNMIKTGTGLRYEIVKQGIGDLQKEGDLVELEFSTQLLTGDTIYTSKEYGNKSFTINKTDEIVGLHEAMLYLKKGAVAKLIIPSHLAYGLSGDGDQIFGQHALVMYIKVLNSKIETN